MKKYRTELVLGTALVLMFSGTVLWFSRHEPEATLKITIAGIAIVLAILVFVSKWMKKKRAIENGEPEEDEFIKIAKLYASSRAYFYSMMLWFLIFIFHGKFSNQEEMLGIGIMGSALIYGICLWYYKSTANFNEQQN